MDREILLCQKAKATDKVSPLTHSSSNELPFPILKTHAKASFLFNGTSMPGREHICMYSLKLQFSFLKLFPCLRRKGQMLYFTISFMTLLLANQSRKDFFKGNYVDRWPRIVQYFHHLQF